MPGPLPQPAFLPDRGLGVMPGTLPPANLGSARTGNRHPARYMMPSFLRPRLLRSGHVGGLVLRLFVTVAGLVLGPLPGDPVGGGAAIDMAGVPHGFEWTGGELRDLARCDSGPAGLHPDRGSRCGGTDRRKRRRR